MNRDMQHDRLNYCVCGYCLRALRGCIGVRRRSVRFRQPSVYRYCSAQSLTRVNVINFFDSDLPVLILREKYVDTCIVRSGEQAAEHMKTMWNKRFKTKTAAQDLRYRAQESAMLQLLQLQ
jgi:hypothetical protein